jgi:hypothetical protein
MAFCNSAEIITLTNYSVKYPGISSLPGGEPFPEDSTGNVASAALNTQLSSLMARVGGSNQEISRQDASIFASGSDQLRILIQNEYCYYYRRYRFGLTKLLNDATAATLPADYNATKTNTVKLNKILNHVIQLLQRLLEMRQGTLNSYYGTDAGQNGVANTNSNLNATLLSLQQHSTALKDNKMEQNVKSSMIDYTIEKNESSRNLLAVYSFMNIVAVGILYQLYTNTAQ